MTHRMCASHTHTQDAVILTFVVSIALLSVNTRAICSDLFRFRNYFGTSKIVWCRLYNRSFSTSKWRNKKATIDCAQPSDNGSLVANFRFSLRWICVFVLAECVIVWWQSHDFEWFGEGSELHPVQVLFRCSRSRCCPITQAFVLSARHSLIHSTSSTDAHLSSVNSAICLHKTVSENALILENRLNLFWNSIRLFSSFEKMRRLQGVCGSSSGRRLSLTFLACVSCAGYRSSFDSLRRANAVALWLWHKRRAYLASVRTPHQQEIRFCGRLKIDGGN